MRRQMGSTKRQAYLEQVDEYSMEESCSRWNRTLGVNRQSQKSRQADLEMAAMGADNNEHQDTEYSHSANVPDASDRRSPRRQVMDEQAYTYEEPSARQTRENSPWAERRKQREDKSSPENGSPSWQQKRAARAKDRE